MKPKIELVALTLLICCSSTLTGELLMITMGGTKSHKIPFWELAKGLIQRGHNITLMSAFPADFDIEGLEEVTPASLVFYVRNYTDWDLVGARMRGEEPVSPFDIMRYPVESCEELLGDHETKELLRSRKNFELIILDGAYPECALGFVHHFKLPFMYINTVGFYTAGLSLSGNPMPFAVTPFFGKAFSDNMNIVERTANAAWHLISMTMHSITINVFLQDVLKKHFGPKMPHVYEMEKNVSFILQNGHFSVTYPRPYLPNVAEIACIHCKPAKPLRKDLEDFISGAGDAGFIFVSMGSSVRAANLPRSARALLTAALGRLPQRVLWKYEGSSRDLPDLTPNVRLEKWLPQQDLLGHPKIRAFVTHGGLLSMFETVYHGVPVVSMPVFCDHDANAHKAELDGYAIKLELRTLTADVLHKAILDVIYKPTYRSAVRRRQVLLRDQSESPLAKAVFWTEYVMRHKGAPHLLSPAKDLNYFQYHMFDVIALLCILTALLTLIVCILVRLAFKILVDQITKKQMVCLEKSKKE